MAINVYCGLMGHGKTYEVVVEVIVPALAKGRNVVTNISGLNRDNIVEFLREKAQKDRKEFYEEDVGQVRFFVDGDVIAPKFYPYDELSQIHDSFVQPGELVVIDEAGRYYLASSRVPREHYVFFTEHRHFVNAKGETCDICFLIQDFSLLHRNIRSVVECVFKMRKLKSLGLSKVYNVTVFDGPSTKAVHRIEQYKRVYNKRCFEFYKSYHGEKGKEQQIDKRQSIFSGKFVGLMGMLLFLVFGGWWGIRHFLDPKTHGVKPVDGAAPTNKGAAPSTGLPNSSRGTDRAESDWRIVGFVGRVPAIMVLAERDGVIRVLNRAGAQDARLQFDGKRTVHGTLNGLPIADWTGNSGHGGFFDDRKKEDKNEKPKK